MKMDCVRLYSNWGKKEEAEAAKEQVAANKDRIAELDQRRGEVEEELTALVAAIPNIPDASVPYGKDDSDNSSRTAENGFSSPAAYAFT